MIGIEQAAQSLGLSSRQLYRRISSVRPVLSGYLRRGENNRLLLDGSALKILRAVEDYRRTGDTVDQAVERIQQSIDGKGPENGGEPKGNGPEISEPWKMVIAAKDETIRLLQDENVHLRGEVERLLPLALPAPRRGLFAIFRRSRATAAT